MRRCAGGSQGKNEKAPLRLNIGNVDEFYSPHLGALDHNSRRRWRSSSQGISGAALLWNLPGKMNFADAYSAPPAAPVCPGLVVVLPGELDGRLVCELDRRLGLGGVEVLMPRARGGSLCADLVCDEDALKRIVQLSEPRGRKIEVAAWGETRELCRLLEVLKERGVAVHCVYGRQGNLDRVARLDSKAGLRELSKEALGFIAAMLPEGEVCKGQKGVVERAATVAQQLVSSGPVVVKAALSTSGVGQVQIKRGHHAIEELVRRIEFAARATPELLVWPLVVERYHRPQSIGLEQVTGYSVQCHTDGVGGARVLFTAAHMALSEELGSCAVIGKGGVEAIGKKRAKALEALGQELGSEVSGWGYSGVFGADFVSSEEGELKLIEINARRTTLSAGGELLALAKQLAAAERDEEKGTEATAGEASGCGEEAATEYVALYFDGLTVAPERLQCRERQQRLTPLILPGDSGAQGWVPQPSIVQAEKEGTAAKGGAARRVML